MLACTNPNPDPCASHVSANRVAASSFCATFTKSSVTATTGLRFWASNCSNNPSAISRECTCAFTSAAVTSTLITTSNAVTTTSRASYKTSTTSGTTATNTCGAAAINSLVGYASGTTGGGSGSGTPCSALTAAAANGGVITISLILDGHGITDLVSDTMLIGVGFGKYTILLPVSGRRSNLFA